MEGDKLNIGGMLIDKPEALQREAETATIYVRPHMLDIDPQPNHHQHFRATVKHIHAAGPQVKVELITAWGAPIQVDMSQERFRTLALKKEAEVFVSPKEMRVFAE